MSAVGSRRQYGLATMDRQDPNHDIEVVDLEAQLADQAPQQRRSSSRRDASTTRSSSRTPERTGRTRLVVIVLGVLALLVGVGAWGAVAYRQLDGVRDDLLAARQELATAAASLQDGDIADADTRLRDTVTRIGGARRDLSAAVVAPLRVVPSYARTLDAVEDLAHAAELIAGAGADITGVLDATGEGLGALTPADGRLPVDTLQALSPVLVEGLEAVQQAQQIVVDVPTVGIDADVRSARQEFLALIDPVAGQVGTLRQVIDVLPAMFGADDTRSYLVVASNPTEARGTGGYFGAYIRMDLTDGRLAFSATGQLYDLPILPRNTIPWPDPSLAARYDPYGGTGFPPNVNMTPDFPAVGQVLRAYYAEVLDDEVDGVLALDPYAFEALLRVAGPVTVAGIGEVTADDVVEFVSHSAYSVFTDPEVRKQIIGEVATAALQGFLDNPEGTSPTQVLDAFSEMVDRQSIVMWAARPEEQAVLADVGLSGALGGEDEGGDLLAVVLNSGAPYKIDYFLQRQVRYDVTLGPDGLAAANLLTGFFNTAPTTGEPDYMIGMGTPPLDVGDALSFVSVYCEPGCDFHEVPDAGFADLETLRGTELGHGVTSTWVRLPAGQSRELAWSYTTPGAWTGMGPDTVYTLRYDHQTTILPVQLQVNVDVPDGKVVSEAPEGAVVEDGVVTLQIQATRDELLRYVFTDAATDDEG